MKKTTMLRNLLNEPGLLLVPGAYDCITARCAELVGFKAVFQSGAGVRDSQLGMPDVGIATASEIVNCAKYMVNAIKVPLIVDADDGYGGSLAAYRTTTELIKVGAAGMFLDDQKHPTKCPFLAVQEVLPREEFYGKIGAVLEARDKEDKDFVIVARIDAAATLGDEELLVRAKGCIKLGVDVILPHAIPPTSKFKVRNKETLQELFKKIGAPEVKIWAMGPHDFSAKDYEEIGAKMWVPGPPNSAVAKYVIELYKGLYEKGTLEGYPAPGGPYWQYLNTLRGIDLYTELERKYVLMEPEKKA